MADDKFSEIKVKGAELLKKVKDLVHEGNIRKIIIKNEADKILLEIPVTMGVVGLALAPLIVLLGAAGALAFNYKITIVKKDDGKSADAAKPDGTGA